MITWVYKGARRANTYLYIDRKDDFSQLPSSITKLMGELEFVLEIDLSARQRLALADIAEVRTKLQEQGFYIQLPPGEFVGKPS